jgi:hypothetical protein
MKPAFISKLANAGRHNSLTWRYGFNLRPTLEYKLKPRRLTDETARVLADLNRDGIAITSAEKLLGTESCFDELMQAINETEQEQSAALAKARAQVNDAESDSEKTFVVELLGSRPLLNPNNVFARFALEKNILRVANAYFEMYTRLRYYNIWHTFTTQAEARQSQLWHRDREDHQILKVFTYFSDVDEGCGPLTYAPGSHSKGHVKREPEYFLEGGVKRSTDEQMARVVPQERWIKGTGSRGTIIFADTHGYHKGGLARENERIMHVSMFTSHASQSQELMELGDAVITTADKEQAFALMHLRRKT